MEYYVLGKGHWEDSTERRVAARQGRPMAFIKHKFHLEEIMLCQPIVSSITLFLY
jgi:hypothetical protein